MLIIIITIIIYKLSPTGLMQFPFPRKLPFSTFLNSTRDYVHCSLYSNFSVLLIPVSFLHVISIFFGIPLFCIAPFKFSSSLLSHLITNLFCSKLLKFYTANSSRCFLSNEKERKIATVKRDGSIEDW
jgi:hypothetical protein